MAVEWSRASRTSSSGLHVYYIWRKICVDKERGRSRQKQFVENDLSSSAWLPPTSSEIVAKKIVEGKTYIFSSVKPHDHHHVRATSSEKLSATTRNGGMLGGQPQNFSENMNPSPQSAPPAPEHPHADATPPQTAPPLHASTTYTTPAQETTSASSTTGGPSPPPPPPVDVEEEPVVGAVVGGSGSTRGFFAGGRGFFGGGGGQHPGGKFFAGGGLQHDAGGRRPMFGGQLPQPQRKEDYVRWYNNMIRDPSPGNGPPTPEHPHADATPPQTGPPPKSFASLMFEGKTIKNALKRIVKNEQGAAINPESLNRTTIKPFTIQAHPDRLSRTHPSTTQSELDELADLRAEIDALQHMCEEQRLRALQEDAHRTKNHLGLVRRLAATIHLPPRSLRTRQNYGVIRLVWVPPKRLDEPNPPTLKHYKVTMSLQTPGSVVGVFCLQQTHSVCICNKNICHLLLLTNIILVSSRR